uniref:Uncharacterized protein n=1 Tax=Populus alba TaxID=43335 RepID=A0A4U5QLI0_POPAL|nr:hypothetical protein D5086_0000071860 [Populus alba]
MVALLMMKAFISSHLQLCKRREMGAIFFGEDPAGGGRHPQAPIPLGFFISLSSTPREAKAAAHPNKALPHCQLRLSPARRSHHRWTFHLCLHRNSLHFFQSIADQHQTLPPLSSVTSSSGPSTPSSNSSSSSTAAPDLPATEEPSDDHSSGRTVPAATPPSQSFPSSLLAT